MKQRYVFFILTVAILTFSFAHAIDIKDVPFKIANFGKVVFSHNDHFRVEGIKNNCKTCHNAIYNLRKKASFTMAQMEKGLSCGACHNGQGAFKIDECAKCHPVKEVEFKLDSGDVKFSHEFHMGFYKCGDCHPKLYLPSAKNKRGVTMTEMEAAKSCGACHNEKDAFTVDRKSVV